MSYPCRPPLEQRQVGPSLQWAPQPRGRGVAREEALQGNVGGRETVLLPPGALGTAPARAGCQGPLPCAAWARATQPRGLEVGEAGPECPGWGQSEGQDLAQPGSAPAPALFLRLPAGDSPLVLGRSRSHTQRPGARGRGSLEPSPEEGALGIQRLAARCPRAPQTRQPPRSSAAFAPRRAAPAQEMVENSFSSTSWLSVLKARVRRTLTLMDRTRSLKKAASLCCSE